MNTPKRLYRNVNEKMIGGVASGFADYFNIDVVLVRILMVIAFFVPIPFCLVPCYIIMWMIMPAKPAPTITIPVSNGGD